MQNQNMQNTRLAAYFRSYGANQDGGAGHRCPAPCVSTSFGGGSGRAGGQVGGEWIDRWLADEEAEYLAALVSFQMQPVQGAAELLVLLRDEGLLAAGLLSHHGFDAA